MIRATSNCFDKCDERVEYGKCGSSLLIQDKRTNYTVTSSLRAMDSSSSSSSSSSTLFIHDIISQ